MKKIKMLVVDDHQLVLDGLKHLLAETYEISFVTFVTSVEEALSLISEGDTPELMIADLYLPGLNGFDLLQGVAKLGLAIPAVVLSSTEEAADIKRAIDLGASGFIPKSAGSEEIAQAIDAVITGQMYLSKQVLSVLEVASTDVQKESKRTEKQDSLSRRQIDTLKLIEQGFTNRQIASILDLSESTVKYHIKALFSRLDANTRTGCIHAAREEGYL